MVLLWSFINVLWLCVFLIVSVAVYMTVKLKKSDKVTKNYYKEIFSESDGDKAMVELKKAKDKLDLGVITQEEYDKIKLELLKYIK
jgi:uncharacterized membrane protein